MEGIRYFVTSEWQFDDDGAASVETVHATAEDARAAARALAQNTDFSAEEIARKSLKIASEICVFTNDHIICETV